MHFYNYVKNLSQRKIRIYIDMDGVVADYDVLSYEEHKTEADVYLNKRPIKTIIDILEKVSTIENVELFILSVARKESQINGKLKWLEKNMPFIDKKNVNIISRDNNEYKSAVSLKKQFLIDNNDPNYITMMIDDSHQVLDIIYDLKLDIIPLHNSSILD